MSVEAQPVASVKHQLAGVIGVDANADHLAVAETDRFGNLIGDAVTRIATLARAAGKPVVIEKLDFRKKKAEIETVDPRQARVLSSFACNAVASGLKSACFRAGVEVIKVNPAYTSVIVAVNYAQARDISVHQGAALAVARRGLGLSERPTPRPAVVPVRSGGHVTFALPVRNRAKHVWSFWSAARTRLRAAHVAHYRSGGHRMPPAPLLPAMQALGAHRSSAAKSRGANRSQHCSESVLEDVPY